MIKRWIVWGTFLILSSPAQAWDIHQTLMPSIIKSIEGDLKALLFQDIPVSCSSNDKILAEFLPGQLQLNSNWNLPPSSQGKVCTPQLKEIIGTALMNPWVDDPDQGMDKNLPDEFDPDQERTWMGGKTGPSSQGFRHMYFGGWNPLRPITTLQIPVWAVGKAPNRAQKMADMSRELLNKGYVYWGVRVLGWSLHYVQDLAQPFHAAQVISFRMVPWVEALKWPPQNGFESLVAETTRTISNYHWAYEGYVRTRLKEENSPFAACLQKPLQYTELRFEKGFLKPENISHQVAQYSTKLAPKLGTSLIRFFGAALMTPDYDLSHNKGSISYERLISDPARQDARTELHKVTCEALANASLASQKVIEYVFAPPQSEQKQETKKEDE